MNTRKLRTATLVGITGLLMAAAGAQAANNVATVKVKNLTTVQAIYAYEYFAGVATPTPSNLAPNTTITFAVTSGSDIVSGMRFTYTAGMKQCRFAASHVVTGGVPTWSKTGTSIGSTSATCAAAITAAIPSSPWNYTVEFSIK